MTHQNLILTEKAIKNHSKRLKKELKILNQDLSLGETQNLFSKTLGFNNFHELKKVFKNEEVLTNKFFIEIKELLDSDYEEEKLDLNNLKNHNLFNIKTINQLNNYLREIEKKYDSFIIFENGNINCRQHNSKDFISSTDFPSLDYQSFLNLLLNHDQLTKLEENKTTKYFKESLIYHIEQIIYNGLIRKIIIQVYFHKKRHIDNINVLITYNFKDKEELISYEEVKFFLEDEKYFLSFMENQKKEQKKSQDIYNQEKCYKIQDKIKKEISPLYLELYNLCIEGNLSGLKKYLNKNRYININQSIPDRSWEPQTAIELALAFENFNIVNYLIDNFIKLNLDLHCSNEYLLRMSCIEGSEEHLKIVKKLFKKISFNNLSKSVSVNNLLAFSYGSNIKLAKFLESQTYTSEDGFHTYFNK